MSKIINLLDDLTINKIAAGEVVEAPYSVVKELIENAIDAEATAITLEIKDGGKKYIRITDNGAGIKEEYVAKAFMRHSTSKITKIDDLNSISSLGFRGEALASIAAVSQVEMITRTSDQQYGIQIEISGGKTESVRKVGCPVGTTIIIKNLFFNTPARLKFMKSNSSETMKITEIITRLCLSNPRISFKYVNNNNIMFTSPGNNELSQAILSVFDKDTFKSLIYLEEKAFDMNLHGYIGQPSFVRGNRNLQIIFINGRYVKNKLIGKAIEDAYKEKVIINKHPICILNLTVDPSIIDVNVHPAKTEVKFQEEEKIYQFILNSLIRTLERNTTIPNLLTTILRSDKSIENKKDFAPIDLIEVKEKIAPKKEVILNAKVPQEEKDRIVTKNILVNEERKNIFVNEDKGKYIENTSNPSADFSIVTNTNANQKAEGNKQIKDSIQNQNNIIEDMDFVDCSKQDEQLTISGQNELQVSFLNTLLHNHKIVGQLFNTYIMLEKDQAMYLIDQHAAHERLLYNKFLEEVKRETVVSQSLLEPKVIELSSEDYLLLFNNINTFTKLGFQIEDFGSNTIIVRQVPMILGKPQNFSFIYEILDEISSNNNIDDYFEDTIIKKACKEAIKAKDRLDYTEIKKLIEELQSLKPPLTCPHGRPIILTMGKYEIEKYFKRIQ